MRLVARHKGKWNCELVGAAVNLERRAQFDLNGGLLPREQVAQLQSERLLLLAPLNIHGSLPTSNCVVVLLLGFFFILDDSFHASLADRGSDAVHDCAGVHGELEGALERFFRELIVVGEPSLQESMARFKLARELDPRKGHQNLAVVYVLPVQRVAAAFGALATQYFGKGAGFNHDLIVLYLF